jgi:hypothetical protein
MAMREGVDCLMSVISGDGNMEAMRTASISLIACTQTWTSPLRRPDLPYFCALDVYFATAVNAKKAVSDHFGTIASRFNQHRMFCFRFSLVFYQRLVFRLEVEHRKGPDSPEDHLRTR